MRSGPPATHAPRHQRTRLDAALLQTLANIGSFVGGARVLLTVVYVATQVRLSVRCTRGATWQSVVAGISDCTREAGLSVEATRMLNGGLEDPPRLAPVEALRFSVPLTSVVRNLEGIHFQYSSDGVSDDAWNGLSTRMEVVMALAGARAR